MIREKESWPTVPAPAIGGWNNFLEPEQIEDNQTPDIQNTVYDGGFVSPRLGSTLFAAKPTGETADPLQLIETQTSDGVEYIIAVYGASF